MENLYNDRVFTKKTKIVIPLWKWVLLCLSKTYKNFDFDGSIITILYAKKIFKEFYIWKREVFEAGILIEKTKLKRVEELCI